MDFAFSFEMCSHCVFTKAKMQTIMQDLQLHLDCHNLCTHMWKTQLKIQFAIPFEKSPEYSSIHTHTHTHNMGGGARGGSWNFWCQCRPGCRGVLHGAKYPQTKAKAIKRSSKLSKVFLQHWAMQPIKSEFTHCWKSRSFARSWIISWLSKCRRDVNKRFIV